MNLKEEELCRKAFYEGRKIKRVEERGFIFIEPTFEGWLRNKKTIKESDRLDKLYPCEVRALELALQCIYDLQNQLNSSYETSWVAEITQEIRDTLRFIK
jgi:hypothetical protein